MGEASEELAVEEYESSIGRLIALGRVRRQLRSHGGHPVVEEVTCVSRLRSDCQSELGWIGGAVRRLLKNQSKTNVALIMY